MMLASFRYRASSADGRMTDGVLRATSQRAAIEELRRQSLYAVDVEEIGSSARAPRRALMRRSAALAAWTRTVAALVGAGIPIDRALAFSAEHARHPAITDGVREVRRAIQSGASLAEAMGRLPSVFPPLVVATVGAGEESGALDEVLQRLADHLEEAEELRSQVRSALAYPVLMAVAAGIGVTVLLLFVVPRFIGMLSETGGRLPLSTRMLVGASHAFTAWWWLWLPALALVVFGARQWLASETNRARFDARRLRWPVVGPLESSWATARFVRTFGMLIRSGMPVVRALRVARTAVANRALAERLARAESAVGRGERLSAALSDALPPLALQMVAAGEESGQLDTLCLKAADSYDGEVRRSLRTLVSLVEPATILLFGALVGFIALAMVQAIYSVNAGGL